MPAACDPAAAAQLGACGVDINVIVASCSQQTACTTLEACIWYASAGLLM
jgi:hypothetical protein